MPRARYLLALQLLVSSVAVSQNSDEPEAACGPLFHQFKLTLDEGERTEVLGPLYYKQTAGTEPDITRLWAAPPLFSYTLNGEVDYELFDFLWKGISYTRFGSEYRLQILELFSFAGGQSQNGTNASRITLFPIYFQQRSSQPEKNYTALFPIYGTIKQRLFRDQMKFLLFPLYGQTRKRDVITDNYLFPVFHLRKGDHLQGWQVWPLVGNEHKEVTTMTNGWGDAVAVGGHDKFFALWPFYFNQHTGLGTTNPVHQQFLIPFYSVLRSPLRDSTSYLWPLGVTHTQDREKKYNEWGMPWPLIVFTRGEGKTTSRVWPFYSRAHNTNLTSAWWLWPIYKYNRLQNEPLDRERTRILFFLYSHTSVKNNSTGERSRQADFLPLFTWKHELQGQERLQLLAPLEPILPNSASVQRNLSPLWSIWRSEHNPQAKRSSQSFCWNLYRRDAAPDTKKCSLLFGLFQYQSGPDGRCWRFFYLPLRKTARDAEPTPQ